MKVGPPSSAELQEHIRRSIVQREAAAQPPIAQEAFEPHYSLPLDELAPHLESTQAATDRKLPQAVERRSRSRAVIAGLALVSIVGVGGVYAATQRGESSGSSKAARDAATAKPTATAAEKPAASTAAAKPALPAKYTFKAVPKQTVNEIPVQIVEPMTEIITLQGDPTPYSFGPNHVENTVFTSSVTGKIKLEIAMTNPGAFVLDKALTATNHIDTYDPVLSAVGINLDYSGLKTSVNKNDTAYVTSLCEAKEAQAKLPLTPQPPKHSSIGVCDEAYQYQHGQTPVSNEINTANQQLNSQKQAIGVAQVAETLRLVDAKHADVQKLVEAYVVEQFHKMAPAGKTALAPFKDKIASFADEFIKQNSVVTNEIDSTLAVHLTQIMSTYITAQKAAKHTVPTDAASLRMIASNNRQYQASIANLPKFSISDNANLFTPEINVPEA